MTGSIFAAQASSCYQAQSSSIGESQARSSKQTDSTFKSQLAAQADVEPSDDSQQNAADTSNGPDFKTSAPNNANEKTSTQQPGFAAWNVSTRQFTIAAQGKPASPTFLSAPALPSPRNPVITVPAAIAPKSANPAAPAQAAVPPETNAVPDQAVKSTDAKTGNHDNLSASEPKSSNNPRQTGVPFATTVAAPGKPASQSVLPAPALPNPRNAPAAVSAAAPPKSANRSQPSQNSTARATGRAGSTNQPAASDSVADSNLTDSSLISSIAFFNVFANPGSGSSDAAATINAGEDKAVKSTAAKAGNQDDLSVSEPESSNNPRQTDVAFALRVSPDQGSSGNPQGGGNASPGHSFHSERELSVVEDRVEYSNAANPRQAEFTQAVIAQPASSAAAASNAASYKASDAPEAGNPTKADPETNTTSGEAVKTLNVRMSAGGDQHVDIRVVERSGELSVSVRSADPALTRTLQDRMPELTSRLQDQHFQADTWVPKSGESSDSRHGGFGSHQDQAQQDGDSGHQGWRGQRQKPEWVEELESIAPNSRN